MVVVACGARTELFVVGQCASCDAGEDAITQDVQPADVPTDVPIDVPQNLCGNGVVDPGEQCDLGSDNSDSPIPFVVSQGGSFAVTPVVRPTSSVAFYDYIGASSHMGIEVAFESRLFLYVDSTSSALSLIVNHNILDQGSGHTTMTMSGIPTGFSIGISDDAGELTQTGPTTAAGNWNWTNNTDGGVIAGLECPGAWTITVSESFVHGINTWSWVNADTSRTPLTIGAAVSIQSFARCRTNCTVPPCGE